ncbi:uncharacterized protein LOC134681645 [Mytilus trossulus]|uniref:uncharacterized protein LOC134681645 n=1 Tax=Mytilus trossulus TaxID=6551 RepID=UPI003003F8E5
MLKNMSHSKAECLHFYEYLCQKIGSETIVRARRLTSITDDATRSSKLIPNITSGSKGEGLDLKGSDIDIMIIHPLYVIYESNKDVVHDRRKVFVMDTEDTPPCFTLLQSYTNVDKELNCIKQNLRQHRGKTLLSSELYKSQLTKNKDSFPEYKPQIHGPCLSICDESLDLAYCLKCDKWVSQAKPWISRSRSIWPSSELISKITSCGILFVPIGNKGSINEHLQWRISFSVAEKILIYSFSHTQLLCYALLKTLLKEIVNGKKELKDLLCSYFLKTLMFWMLEENDTSVWRPDNIIPCFMACLKRLLYCVEYSTLLHYFIPNNNLFYLRFNNKQRNSFINVLKKSYQNGIQIFSSSQTLQNYRRFPCETTRSVCEITTLIKVMIKNRPVFSLKYLPYFYNLYTLLHHCKSELSRCIFQLSIIITYRLMPFAPPHVNNPNNKQHYKLYKHDLSKLLVGVGSDAVSGWLKLASFFYGQNNYLTSIDIINYTLSKCEDEAILSKISLTQTKTLKLMSLVKKIPSPYVCFDNTLSDSFIPMELKSPHTFELLAYISSIPFAHFLRFLCCYHLQDFKSSWNCMNKLLETVREYDRLQEGLEQRGFVNTYNILLQGIAFQMLGKIDLARKYFHIAAQEDPYNKTSAAFRLHQLC